MALTKYGDMAASTRQRLLQYGPALQASGCDLNVRPLLNNDYLSQLNQNQNSGIGRHFKHYLDRVAALVEARSYDAIWLNYETFPYLPALLERAVFLPGPPVILDLDDATFHQYDHNPKAVIRWLLGKKLAPLISNVAACVCGNEYIANYAREMNDNVHIVPTVVDTASYFKANNETKDQIKIGWIGSPTTWRYVLPYVPLLSELAAQLDVRIKVVGAGNLDSYPDGIEFVDWSEKREVAEIQDMDIGIMPLPDEPWARGKCGYKLIQYQACGLPVIASPIGVNSSIVDHNVTGFLVETPDEWKTALVSLIEDQRLRESMGDKGRQNVSAHYSLKNPCTTPGTNHQEFHPLAINRSCLV